MRCPTLAELPSPLPGKTGWPWTEESSVLPDTMPDGSPWPCVTIVTPSYNQGQFIEETIRSVLLQGYPNLEYIIMDGGSTDDSVEIIRKYDPWLAHWVSQPDGGQSNAINKGFERATGEIYAWLNSDDTVEPNAVQCVTKYFVQNMACMMLYGNGSYLDASGKKTGPITWVKPFDRRLRCSMNFMLQPATFWRRSLWDRTGGLDPSLNWVMDWEWFVRVTELTEPSYLHVDLATWRVLPSVKTLSGGKARSAEIAAVNRRHGGLFQPGNVIFQVDRIADWMVREVGRGSVARIPQYPITAIRIVLRRVYRDKYFL